MENSGRTELRISVPVLAAAIAVAASLVTPAIAAKAPTHPKILVQNFDLFDTSIDHRAFVVADQKKWLIAANAKIRSDLSADHNLSVVDTTASRSMTAAIGKTYEHPSTCRSCAIAEARQLGAQYVFIGSVHKISDLIIYMRGELDSVSQDKPIMVKSMEVKADNRTMVLRGAATMADAIAEQIKLSD